MTARSACASTTVDTAAIAAAVAAELDVPTAAENATAVGAQAACAAAITAASLATAGAVSTLQTAVNLLPVDADVTTLVGAVVDSKLADIGAAVALAVPDTGDIQEIVSPAGTGPFKTAALTGSTSYDILAAVPGQVHTLYGYQITVSNAAAVVTWGSAGTVLTASANISAGAGASATITVAPGSRKSLVTATNEALRLNVSNTGASVVVTYWSRTAAP